MTSRRPADFAPGTVCDFCASPAITWAYPCESFSMGVATDKEKQLMNSWGGWASCDTCHDLIETGKDRELADRSASQNRGVLSEGLTEKEFEMLSAMLFTMHEQFRAGRKGPAIAWKPGDPMPGPLGPPEGPWANQPDGHWTRWK
jgi:hypothetical protein